jgi:hypothetical protein
MVEDLKILIERRNELARQALEVYRPQVERLISYQTTNDLEIERRLDHLLDFCFDDQILLLFKKLCRYYWDINPQATADYVNYYRDMWDEESKKENDDN